VGCLPFVYKEGFRAEASSRAVVGVCGIMHFKEKERRKKRVGRRVETEMNEMIEKMKE